MWRDIGGYEGLYQANDQGDVMSIGYGKKKILHPSNSGNGYLVYRLFKNKFGKRLSGHQIVAMAFLNHIPDSYSLVIDHINGIGTDNRLLNLRIVTHAQNLSVCYKREKHGCTSSFRGVSWHKPYKKWRANITKDGKSKHIGYYFTEMEAHEAYQIALKSIILN